MGAAHTAELHGLHWGLKPYGVRKDKDKKPFECNCDRKEE